MRRIVQRKKAFNNIIVWGKRLFTYRFKKLPRNTTPQPSEEKKQYRIIVLKDDTNKLDLFSSLQEFNNN